MGRPVKLAVCVDDYGLHAGVNEAVLQLAATGRISTVSCMTGAPAWSSGGIVLRALANPALEVGLHFDLTEQPLRSRPRPVWEWIVRGALDGIVERDVAEELHAQLDRFEQGMGRAPSHVDGHQHVHQLRGIRDVVLRVLAERYPGDASQRPWLRVSRPAGGARSGMKSRVISLLGSGALSRDADAADFDHSARLLGVYDFEGDEPRYAQLLRGWLAQAREGDLLMCHPAKVAPRDDAIGAARVREFNVLGSERFGRLLADAGVQVAPLRAPAANDCAYPPPPASGRKAHAREST
jgi:predicted glycoside hydrolase/deacetylase ChbG (UPF0249 family)